MNSLPVGRGRFGGIHERRLSDARQGTLGEHVGRQRREASPQKPLLDYGREMGERGQASALSNADPAWKDAAMAAIRSLAEQGRSFTSEDVRRIVGDPDVPNAVGAIFRAAARMGIIAKTGRYRRPSRIELRGKELAVWSAPIPEGHR